MSENQKRTSIGCSSGTRDRFNDLADGLKQDAFLRRLLTLWESVTPVEREHLMTHDTTDRETDDARTD